MRILMILLLVGGAAGGLWYWNETAPQLPKKIGVFSPQTGLPIIGVTIVADTKLGEVERIGVTDRKGHVVCKNPGIIDQSTIRAAGFDWDRVEDAGKADQGASVDIPIYLTVNEDKVIDEAEAEKAAESL